MITYSAFESAIVNSYVAAVDYADAHLHRYKSPIGEDYVLGPAWVNWLRSIRVLLNGETGGLDCGTMDRNLIELAEEHGMRLDDIWEK